MTRRNASSGDILADRRFSYAEMAAEEGDHLAARDLLDQALDIAPQWLPAHLARAKACFALGETAEAEASIAACLRLDPADPLGAGLLRAQMRGEAGREAMSDAFVAGLFDGYAGSFDRHLREDLKYCAPELIAARLEDACARLARPAQFRLGFDLGCGTGLMAVALKELCTTLHGVDLSSRMLAEAERTGLYASLTCAELTTNLANRPSGFDLVLAADVFCYVPDLAPVFGEVRRILGAGGLFAFTIQSHGGAGTIIGADARVHHAPGELESLASRCGFRTAVLEPATTRQDRGNPVPGHLFVLAG